PDSSTLRSPLSSMILSSPLLPPSRPTPFPYTPLFRSTHGAHYQGVAVTYAQIGMHPALHRARTEADRTLVILDEITSVRSASVRDRKSTRLNSSHVSTSYAVFCLKKKSNRSTGISLKT